VLTNRDAEGVAPPRSPLPGARTFLSASHLCHPCHPGKIGFPLPRLSGLESHVLSLPPLPPKKAQNSPTEPKWQLEGAPV